MSSNSFPAQIVAVGCVTISSFGTNVRARRALLVLLVCFIIAPP